MLYYYYVFLNMNALFLIIVCEWLVSYWHYKIAKVLECRVELKILWYDLSS